MNRILFVAAFAATALGLAACDKPGTRTAYINSGASATPAMPPTSAPSKPATEYSPQDTLGEPRESREAATSTAMSDTASPSTAPQK